MILPAYQKNAILTLNQHIATIVPESIIQVPTIKGITSGHLSSHKNILTSSVDMLEHLTDDVTNILIDDITGFMYSEYDVPVEQTKPIIKLLIQELLTKNIKMSLQAFKGEIMGQVSTMSSMIQFLMSDDILSVFSGDGIDNDKLSHRITSKLDRYLPTCGGFDLSANTDFVAKSLDKTVQNYLSIVENKTLKNNMGDFYNIIKTGSISQSELGSIVHDTLDKIEPYAKTFVTEWGGFSQMVDATLDPLNEILFKDSMCFKTSSNILGQLKHEYSKSVDAQSIELQTKNSNLGFCDPDFKFPPPKGTLSPFNSTFQVLNMIATSTPPWTTATGKVVAQPTTSKNSKYPHNSRNVSKSGHIQEVDDTPGHERIMTQHKSGTMTETDAKGTHINKIVGDKYTIVDKNGYVYIEGACDVVINGALSIKTSNNMEIQVLGNANINVHGSASVGVGGACGLQVADLLSVNAGEIAFHSHGDIRMKADGDIVHESVGDVSIKAGKNIKSQAGLSINNKAGKDIISSAGKTVSVKANDFIANAAKVGIKASGTLALTGDKLYANGSSVDIKASGALNMDGGVSYWQSSKAGTSAVAAAVDASDSDVADVSFGSFTLPQAPLAPPFIETTPATTQFDIDTLPFNGDVP